MNEGINLQAICRKAWLKPELTIIDRNDVAGGGARSSLWERTGQRVNRRTSYGARITDIATINFYNTAIVHS